MYFRMNPRAYVSSITAAVISVVSGVSAVITGIYAEFYLGVAVGILLLLCSAAFTYIASGENLSRVRIDRKGVSVTTLGKRLNFIPWEDIKTMGFGLYNAGRCHEAFLYFSCKELTERQRFSLDKLNPRRVFHTIKLAYTPQALKEVQKYWKGKVNSKLFDT